MKIKYLFLIGLFLGASFFIFSSPVDEVEKNIEKDHSSEKRAIFISYIELGNYLRGKSSSEGKVIIQQMVDNVSELGFSMIILQVRTFSDAIYDSTIYPWSSIIAGVEGKDPNYDPLEVFIEYGHKKDLEVHAWINPYRIRTDNDTSDISTSNPAYSYLGTSHVMVVADGVYYNPASSEVRELITEGVEEIVKSYDVDGILFDDYFYPNSEIDLDEYSLYHSSHPDTSIEEFRLLQVNLLVEMVYDVCQKYDVLFGISPDGNIENNYQTHYADVRTWGGVKGYVDYLMPQIYYGFYNETKAFVSVLEEWEEVASKVDLMVALAFYKVGTVDTFAKSGSNEWLSNDDIIMREILLSRNAKHYLGFSLFRYDYLFNQELETATTSLELKNVKQVLK